MRRIKIGRAGIGIAVFVCVVAIGAPTALAVRGSHSTAKAGNVARGQVVFNTYFCAACHTLKAAGPSAYGQLGVNLNKTKAPLAVAVAAVTNGLPAALPLYPTQMVGYKNVLTKQQIQDVSAFVAKYSGTYKKCEECAPSETT
jgi:mono/diheme cytochrome c family protein